MTQPSAEKARHDGAAAARAQRPGDPPFTDPPFEVADWLKTSWMTGYNTARRLMAAEQARQGRPE